MTLARRMALRWCRCFADAEDVAQEAILQYFEQRAPPLNPPAWLFVVTRRLCHRRSLRDRVRARAEEVYLLERSPAPAAPDLLIDVDAILQRLAPRDRRLILRVLEGALSREIAVEFDCKVQDVGQMVARARDKSRVLFNERKKKK